MMQRMSLKKNYYLLLVCMVIGLLFISYHLTNNNNIISPAIVEEQCVPKRNVVFLKTHKTAGSTIQNIFMRYAKRNNLLLVLPLKGNYLGHPYHFEEQMAPRLRHGYKYNILTHHSRFHFGSMKSLFPEDVVFVTILRDPVALFESLYAYYTLNVTYQMDIVEYAMSNGSYLDHHNQRFYGKIGRNQMAFDLGVTKFMFDSDSAITRAARRFDRQFHLVMIAEMMDQSLVLLKDLLCWDIDDIVAFRHNARMEGTKVLLGPDVVNRLRSWNRADQLLYNFFVKRLKEQILEFGVDRMAKEVALLRKRSNDFYDYCVADEVTGSNLDEKFRVYNDQVLGFRLRDDVYNETCEDMAKAELPFTRELQKKQLKYLAISTTVPSRVLIRKKMFQRYYP